MARWRALLVAALALLPLAGCLGHPGGEPSADRPTGGDEGSAAVGPETLYLIVDVNRGRLSDHPMPPDQEGWGFADGGAACDPPPDPGPCWSDIYEGSARAAHKAGDPVHLWLWLQGESAMPVVVEAWLESHSTRIAEGRAQPVQPLPGSPAPGPDGCTLAEADLPLAADVPEEASLSLGLRVDGLFGTDCFGGGAQGSRIAIGLPGAPS